MVVLGVLMSAIAGCASPEVSPKPGAVVRVADASVESGFARRLSAVRAEPRDCGGERYPAAGPVRWDRRLAVAAGRHSGYLAALGRLSHTGRGGVSLDERIRAAGYGPRAWAENLAAGQSTADEAIRTWLASPGHCRNLMGAAYTEVGIAAARGGDGRLYWTLVLATPLQ